MTFTQRITADDLAEAITSRALTVHLQPIVTLPARTVTGFEALARWTHPSAGPVPPSVFIPLAESSGLVPAVGRAVLEAACRGAAELAQQLPGLDFVSVNASGLELTEPGYADGVAAALTGSGWSADKLLVEVTESTLDADSEQAAARLAALAATGVRASIDDFGTGYSSLARLASTPASYLKLDATFTSGITTCPRRAAILKSLLALSADLGMSVIAEGVETPQQAFQLHTMGCPLVQGYFFGRPQSVRQLTAHAA